MIKDVAAFQPLGFKPWAIRLGLNFYSVPLYGSEAMISQRSRPTHLKTNTESEREPTARSG